ncbi:tripartite tricarboxylate transporter substrate binding protein [Afifella sp. IM 167]|uniref:tripartite tricarboxylate transporter substrate binding protein n=1 Tax=Afifella sp. IM 167 TaxID=2033586 RepID=UPI001CCB6A51|nr:tripartite tricarboxylate transporter substrate binding protein [Afifella sp. IM 167]
MSGWRKTFIGACGLALLAAPVGAAEMLEKPDGYGNRPITIIVPYGAGGGSDQLARAWADAAEKVAGLTFQIVNKPGGGGTAAIPDFMLARPDGYTIMEAIDDAVSAYASGDIKENPAEDWSPICMTQITFNQIYIRSDDDRFSDWKSFVAYAEAHPGEVTVANLGKVQSMERITMAQLEESTGLKFKQIPFDKPAERYGALIGGHVDALFEQPGDVRNFIQADQMKPILTFLDERPELFADTPTSKEVGADFDPLTRFRGFYVKSGVPEDRIAFLENVCKAAFETEAYTKFNKDKYMDVIDSFRDHKGAVALINNSAKAYKEMYEKLGL